MTEMPADTAGEPAPDDLIPVGFYPTLAQAQERTLVVLCRLEACMLAAADDDSGYALMVERRCAPRMQQELAEYEREQEAAPPEVRIEPRQFPGGGWGAILWTAAILVGFLAQGDDPSLTSRWASSSERIVTGGEFWRPLTSLFLHADLHHLFSNVALGSLFGILACRSLGAVLGWALVLVSGTAGNFLNAIAYFPHPHSAIGASTAVFGALGLLTGFGICMAFRLPSTHPWGRVLLPLGGGIALLAWFGAGGPGVDLGGHLFGFLAGIALGIPAGWFRHRMPPASYSSLTKR